jgi:hypothetical protein
METSSGRRVDEEECREEHYGSSSSTCGVKV